MPTHVTVSNGTARPAIRSFIGSKCTCEASSRICRRYSTRSMEMWRRAAAAPAERCIPARADAMIDYVEAARFCNTYGAHATTIDACRLGLAADPDNAMLYVYRA